MEVRIQVVDSQSAVVSLSLDETKELLGTLLGLVVAKEVDQLEGHYGVDKDGTTVPLRDLLSKVYDN